MRKWILTIGVVLVVVLVAIAAVVASRGDDDPSESSPGRPAPSTPVDGSEATPLVLFEHAVLDPDPPSGDECCLDVLTTGDVDGDGAIDVLIASEHADGASWYRNPGGEGEWQRFPIGGGDFTTDGEAADLDGDADLDFVASAIDRNVVEWWEQVGDPTSEDGWERHDIGPDLAHDLVVVDLDADGDLDVAAYHHDAQRIDWFEQSADGAAWEHHVVDERAGEGLAAADLDGDGSVDLVAGPAIYRNVAGDGSRWERTPLDGAWPDQARAAIGDIDGDGSDDVVLSSPETEGPLAWFAAPDWTRHEIEAEAGYSHSLEVGDVDGDGHLDVFVGVMEWAGTHTIRVLLGDGGTTWREVLLGTEGTHNARLVDLDGDGRLDVVGKNFQGPKAVEVWWNRGVPAGVGPADASFSGFTHVQVDDARSRFNDMSAFFGLGFGDLDGDGDDDIVSGAYAYLNPGGDLTGEWGRVDLAEQVGATVDAMLVMDVDGDEHADVIATALPDVWWLEAEAGARQWSATRVAELPATPYPNGQGYETGDLDGDGRPEIVLSAGEGESDVWLVDVPADPSTTPWPTTRITEFGSGEDLSLGDVDGDGDLDVASADVHDGGMYIAWFENDGSGRADWTRHRIGEFDGEYPDRLHLADLDGDGRLDIVVSEETAGEDPTAVVLWYRQGDDPRAADWDVQVLAEQYSTNSLDVADIDGDGDVDLSTGEHKGRLRVALWENLGVGSDGRLQLREHVVDEGKESHLGARLWDLDGDGDLEVVSIAWSAADEMHLWVNS